MNENEMFAFMMAFA